MDERERERVEESVNVNMVSMLDGNSSELPQTDQRSINFIFFYFVSFSIFCKKDMNIFKFSKALLMT